MKAAVLTGIRKMELVDVPKPTIQGRKDVLLKLERIGVCGSDVHYYTTGRIGHQIVQYPYLVGHECSATVAEVGRGVKKVKLGDQVVVEAAVSCHKCPQCKLGRENTCYKLKFLGTPGQGDGCLREYMVMPEECCLPTKGKLTLEQAALCEPFTIGVYTVQQSRLPKNARIAILGAGPIGLSCMVAAKVEKAKAIYVTDKLDYRVDLARKNGASWAGNPDNTDVVKTILEKEPLGVDVAYECAGQQATLNQCVEVLRPGGTLVIVGIPEFDIIQLPVHEIRRRELTIINIRRQNRCTEYAMKLVGSHKAKIDFMLTHRFKFEQSKEAFELVADYRDGVIKAMIEF